MNKTATPKKPSTVRAQYRVNSQRKQKAEAILNAQGIRPSQAIDMFLAEVIRERGFPFKCSGVPNEETAKILREVDEGIDLESFDTKEEMFASLSSK